MTDKIIDIEMAVEQAGGSRELADELFGMLLAELPQFDADLRSAFGDADWAALQHNVHKLNGAATYCGVPALKAAADRLETDLKQGNEQRIPPGLEQLLAEIARVQDQGGLLRD